MKSGYSWSTITFYASLLEEKAKVQSVSLWQAEGEGRTPHSKCGRCGNDAVHRDRGYVNSIEEPTFYLLSVSSFVFTERKRWRPGALSGTSWDSRPEEEQFQSNPPWPVQIYNPAGEDDALNTMSELLQGETSPPRARAHVRSIDSLSTVSAAGVGDHHHQPSIAGTFNEIDRIDQHVRRSLHTRSRGIPVALVDPGPVVMDEDERRSGEDEPPPLPSKLNDPEHISYVSVTPRPGTQPPLGSPPFPASSHQSVKNYFLSPQSQHDQLGLEFQSEQTASPGQHTVTMTPRRRESLAPSDRTASPPPQRTLSPIQNLPQVHERTEDVSSDVGQVSRTNSRTNSTKSKRSTPQSGVGRSLTYQRALNMGTPVRDPLPVRYDSAAATLTRLASIRSVPPATAGVEMSDGRALVEAKRAFYGTHRSASQRFFWGLPAKHDQRVLDMLNWIEEMAAPIASRGVRTERSNLYPLLIAVSAAVIEISCHSVSRSSFRQH